ncbi:hypothetical protein E2C01_069812 [Portunus trituberculatus]|uniref:Uncharacterized protein n=1 Tax=Portunus trituberculatus TaxID=210409 RepID=A0A5B7HZY1_PORTR|nr:hypothetical protein [Portunus trituberculatus]
MRPAGKVLSGRPYRVHRKDGARERGGNEGSEGAWKEKRRRERKEVRNAGLELSEENKEARAGDGEKKRTREQERRSQVRLLTTRLQVT